MLPSIARRVFLLVFWIACTLSASGQSAPLPVQHESVTVTTEPVPFDTLSGSFTSLSHEALLASGVQDAAEALRFVSSVHFSRSGSQGSLSTVSIRGGKPNFTLVLIDGIPANDISDQLGGAFNFATVDTDQIERIDIYRGPLSTIYGSEAIGGVINIIPRRPEDEPVFHFNTEGGQYGYARAFGGVSGKLFGIDLAANGGFSRMGVQVLADGSTLGVAELAGDRTFAASKILHSFVRWNRLADSELPVSSGGPIDAISTLPEINDANQIAAGAQFHQVVNSHWLYSAGGGLFSRVASDNTPAIFDTVPPGPSYVPSRVSHTRFLRSEGDTTQQIIPLPWLVSYTTLSVRDEDGTSAGQLDGYPDSFHLQRTTVNVAEDANVHGRRGSLGGGFGVQKSSSYGAVVSPRAGGTLNLAGYRFHASWGEGFNLPSFYSLGDPLVGNPALKAETSRGIDAGVAHAFSNHSDASVSYFDNRYHNLIDFSPSLFKLVNRNEAFARGFDLDASQRWKSVSLGGSVTYVDAGLEGTTERLHDVPRWTEEIHARIAFPREWSAQLSTAWVGRRFDYQVPVPSIMTVPRYTLTNVQITHSFARLDDALVVYLHLANVFNSKFQEFIGFPNIGISASAGLRYSFSKHRKHPVSSRPLEHQFREGSYLSRTITKRAKCLRKENSFAYLLIRGKHFRDSFFFPMM